MNMHLAALLAASLLSVSPEVLVLRSGETIAVRQVVSADEQRIVFRDAHGVLFSLPMSEIDLERTERQGGTDDSGRTREDRARRSRLAVSDDEKERLLRTLEKTARPGSSPAPLRRNEAAAEPEETENDTTADEEFWRARGRAARERIADAEYDLEEAIRYERELNAFLLAMAGPSGIPEVYGPYMRDLSIIRERIPRLREEVSRARDAFDELKTEANRAGAMPGWLR